MRVQKEKISLLATLVLKLLVSACIIGFVFGLTSLILQIIFANVGLTFTFASTIAITLFAKYLNKKIVKPLEWSFD